MRVPHTLKGDENALGRNAGILPARAAETAALHQKHHFQNSYQNGASLGVAG